MRRSDGLRAAAAPAMCTIPDPVRALEGIARVLRPGGLFIVIDGYRGRAEADCTPAENDALTLLARGMTVETDVWQRLMTPNFASIMPQVIGVWCEELGHGVRVECYTGREDLREQPAVSIDSEHTREIAAALEDLYQEESEVVTVQLARHYAEAGQVEQAVDYLLQAGDRVEPGSVIMEGMGLNITVLSYMDRIDIGLTSDPELVPDLWDMADLLPAALDRVLARGSKDLFCASERCCRLENCAGFTSIREVVCAGS